MKPENVLYDPENDRLLVADFGIAHFAEPLLKTLVQTGAQERLANFRYAAPEQRAGGKVDHRADIYALGLMLNEMYTGRLLLGTDHTKIGSIVPEYAYLDELVDLMARQLREKRLSTIDEIKKQLIARGHQFVSLQKLDRLKSTVIRSDEPEDPLLAEPVGLSGLDFERGQLHLLLSCPPNGTWIEKFKSMGTYESIVGKEPYRFEFYGDRAVIPANERDTQQLVDYFKGYVETTNREYRHHVLREQKKLDDLKRQELEATIAGEEQRQRILRTTKI